MGKYKIKVEKAARRDLKAHLKSGSKSTILKIETIFKELAHHPYSGIGNPEQLKYDLSGYWSRRINKKDRLIYKVEENIVTVLVVSAMGHYFDK